MHNMPQHNGIAESLNCRLLKCVRAILHQAGLPKNLWGKALQFAVWLKNRTSTKALGTITPYKQLYRQKPNLSKLLEWGQTIWVHNPSGSKLDAQGLQAQWVGYNANSTHTHHVYWPGKNTVSVEWNVKFVSPTIVINTLPPSYVSTIVPGQVPAAAPSASSPAAVPATVQQQIIPPTPVFQQQPLTPSQPIQPPCSISAPPQTFLQQPQPVFLLPPPASFSQMCNVGKEEEEVEDTIMPQCYTVLTIPSAGPLEPCRSACISHPPDYYHQLAGENVDAVAEHLDYVFSVGYDELIAGALNDLDGDLKMTFICHLLCLLNTHLLLI